QPPIISLVRGTPSSGPLTNGQSFTLQVSATDDLGITNITVIGLGTIQFVTNFTDGAGRTLNFIVPGNAAPGGLFQFRAQATDALGAKSLEAAIDLQIRDSGAPVLAILSPADNSLLNLSQPFNLVVRSC